MTFVRAAALGLLLACAAAAQDFDVGPTRDAPPEECLHLQVLAIPLAARPGGQGWADVLVENQTTEAHELKLELGQPTRGSRVSSARSLSLAPGTRRRTMLPLPSDDLGAGPMMATVDGGERHLLDVKLGVQGKVSLLVVSADPSGVGLDLQQSVERDLSDTLVAAWRITGAQLPDSWTLISGADLLMLDGATHASAESQQVLLDAVAAGARLHVTRPELLLEDVGPLASLLAQTSEESETESGAGLSYGFGWLSAGPLPDDSRSDEWCYYLPTQSDLKPDTSGFPADAWLDRLAIPGLNEVPTGLFLMLLLGFIVFVAWRSFALLKQRRPLRLLVLLPGSGMAMTVGLLAAGLLSEGIGLRGARRSLTLLDQRTHRAASVCQSTVYAALAAGALEPRPETLLASGDLLGIGFREAISRTWHVDLDAGGRVAAGAVPPRTPTQLAAASVGLARERLRFRRVDGAFDVVADAELRPLPGAGRVLLRDFEGATYIARADGRLVRSGTAGVSSAVITDAFSAMPFDVPPVTARMLRFSHTNDDGAAARYALNHAVTRLIDAMPPGSYAAVVGEAPAVDGLQLDVDWLSQVHIVIGRLAPEDIDG